MIKTPDQRVRVFISSTIHELADERASVKQAVEKLRLTPVLFEISARHHPPKELYRAYLEQSDIFIGIYWNSYGWVGPDMNISGLEDEYDLSSGKSKLIYVKSSESREEKLNFLLDKIRENNSVCYKPFKNASELKELVENDLAILLSENFQSRSEETATSPIFIDIPVTPYPLIGRDKDIESITKLITGANCKLINVIGTGGTGKTSLAIELANHLKYAFKNGIVFFSLASISAIDHIPSFLASKFKLQGSGDQSVREVLISWLSDKQMLLVLDNLEQIIEIRALIADILKRCAGIRIICTSRTPLRIMHEHIYPLYPLPKPGTGTNHLMENPAMQLFIERATQVNPALELDGNNVFAIRDICNQVDGLPLAIELAAMRTRYFPPSLLVENFHRALDLGAKGPKDLPLRQQTLSNTIGWSYGLLDEQHQLCFRLLAIFRDGCTIAALGSLIRFHGIDEDAADMMEGLLDVGLVQLNIAGQSIRYTLFVPIREYAMEQLIQHNEWEATKQWHCNYYTQLLLQFEFQIHGTLNTNYRKLIISEYENMRLAYDCLIETRDLEKAWRVISALSDFWSAEGKFLDALQWMDKAEIRTGFPVNELSAAQKDLFARALQLKGMLLNFKGDYQQSADHLHAASSLFDELENNVQQSITLALLGLSTLNLDNPDASAVIERSIAYSTSINENFGLIISYAFYADIFIKQRKLDVAIEYIRRAEEIAKSGYESYLGLVYLSLGNFYLAAQDIAKAVETFDKCLADLERSNFKTASGWALISLANCYFLNKDIAASIRYSRLVLDYARNMGHSILLLHSLMGISLLLVTQRKEEVAVRLYLGADHHHKKINARLWASTEIWLQHFHHYMHPIITRPEYASFHNEASSTTLDELIALANVLE